MKKIIATIATLLLATLMSLGQSIMNAEAALEKGELDKAKSEIDGVVQKEIDKIAEKNAKLKAKGKTDKIEPEEPSTKTLYTKGSVYQAIALSENPDYQSLVENPVEIALEAYQKIMKEESENSPLAIQTNLKIDEFYRGMINLGANFYNADDMANAADAFYKAGLIYEEDTTGLPNAFIIAFQEEMEEDVEKIAALIRKRGTGNSTFYTFYPQWLRNKENYEKMLEVAKEGKEAYPEDENMFRFMVEAYNKLDRIDDAIALLEQEAENSDDHIIYGNLAIMYENKGNEEKAKENYLKALKIKPNDFGMNYNMGAMYYNKAANLSKERNNLPANNRGEFIDQEKAEELQKQIVDYFKEAEPFFVKAYEADPEGNEAYNLLSMLSQMYRQMGMDDKKKEIDAKLKEME